MAKPATTGTQSDTLRRTAADVVRQPPRPQPRAVAPASQPQGQRLAGNLGPGTLYPGAGRLVQRNGTPLYCGTITGRVFGATEHPNTRDPKRVSVRFAGTFLLVDHAGTVIQGMECYLPGNVTRAVQSALKLSEGNGTRAPVDLSLEVWCEPDAEGRPPSPLGYSYVTYDRRLMRENDPLLALAYESGILERPTPQLTGPEADSRAGTDVDPETGEVSAKPSQAA